MNCQYMPISLAEKEKYYKLWDVTPRKSLDYTLANLWGWQEYFGLEWCLNDEIGWIRQTKPHEIYWAPLGNWDKIDWSKILPEVITSPEINFTRVPLELTEIWQNIMLDKIEVKEERGQWEYLYSQEALTSLAGNKLHKKKNHYNSYIKTYGEPDYREIKTENIKDVLNLQHIWCHWHECDDSPSLIAENEAIQRVLTHWGQFRNMIGGSLYISDKMIAFSVGETLNPDMLGVHFEKGLNEYKGVYQAINCEFAKHAGKKFKWIDRAQDMDEEGLRQAKMTYNPQNFLKKDKIIIKK